jgi:hypothetical protein
VANNLELNHFGLSSIRSNEVLGWLLRQELYFYTA